MRVPVVCGVWRSVGDGARDRHRFDDERSWESSGGRTPGAESGDTALRVAMSGATRGALRGDATRFVSLTCL